MTLSPGAGERSVSPAPWATCTITKVRAYTILLVEDDFDVREALVETLRELGHSVDCAADGEQALAYLRGGRRPGLILLDLMMPRMSGWELLEHLGRDRALASIPVCVVSASGASLPSGAQTMLSKPFDIQRLLDVVARHAGPP